MAKKPVTDKEPIMWACRYWSYLERGVGGESHHHVVGFLYMSFYKKIGDFFIPPNTQMIEMLLGILFFSGIIAVVVGPILNLYFIFSSGSFILGSLFATFVTIKSEHNQKLRRLKNRSKKPQHFYDAN